MEGTVCVWGIGTPSRRAARRMIHVVVVVVDCVICMVFGVLPVRPPRQRPTTKFSAYHLASGLMNLNVFETQGSDVLRIRLSGSTYFGRLRNGTSFTTLKVINYFNIINANEERLNNTIICHPNLTPGVIVDIEATISSLLRAIHHRRDPPFIMSGRTPSMSPICNAMPTLL